jgi:hypothetical protein
MSTFESIDRLLTLLLIESMPPEQLVQEEFFAMQHMIGAKLLEENPYSRREHWSPPYPGYRGDTVFVTCRDEPTPGKGSRPYNTKYNLIFVHDPPPYHDQGFPDLLRNPSGQQLVHQIWDQYIRRFSRLKHRLTHSSCASEPVCFVIQVLHGVYTIDGKPIYDPESTPQALERIINLLTSLNKNNKFVLFGKHVPFTIDTNEKNIRFYDGHKFEPWMVKDFN